MSGHSKWHRIKRKKEAADNKRGQEFTRLANQISSSARNNSNPDQNPALREAITRAKQANMPQSNIDKILQKATDSPQENVIYEAFGPAGVALLIDCQTDNPKRTVAELRTILKSNQGTLSEPGSVMWKFKPTTNNKYTAQYPVQLDPPALLKLSNLTKELCNHPDVNSVFADST